MKKWENKGLFFCNDDAHDKPVHFECFQKLVTDECNSKYLTCSKDGKEVAIFVCGKHCYNSYCKVLKNKARKNTPTGLLY